MPIKKKPAPAPKPHGFDILEFSAIQAFKQRGDSKPLGKLWQQQKGKALSLSLHAFIEDVLAGKIVRQGRRPRKLRNVDRLFIPAEMAVACKDGTSKRATIKMLAAKYNVATKTIEALVWPSRQSTERQPIN